MSKSLNYIPDTIYSLFSPDDITNICVNKMNTEFGVVNSTERGSVICPFGSNDSVNKGVFFREPINNNTVWGKVPQLTPRPLSRIGMEWRN